MATTKLITHRPISQLLFLRYRTNSTSAVTATSSPPSPSQPPVLDLTNPEKLFSSMPTSKLLRATLNLQIASIESMVDLATWVINATLAGDSSKGPLRRAVRGLIRHTVFEHFCCGEDAAEAMQSVRRLNRAGFRGMVDFAAEFTSDNAACDYNFGRFLDAVGSSMSLPPSSVSSVVVKMTAICPLNLLVRVSDLLRWQQRDPSFNLSWKGITLPIFADSSPLYHTLERPEPLTQHEEEQDLRLAEQRLWTLCEKCVEANVPLVVDGEHIWFQPAIDHLTNSASIMYNNGGSPIVYNTIQTYLKDAKERLLLAFKAAEKMGVPVGYKVVRGAYMPSERKLASELGYEWPIHDTIVKTPERIRKRSRNNNETSGCQHCNCKKSNCLKLCCECFSAGSYCDDGCSCEKCLNKPEYEDTVDDFRKQIELRNPHAFAARKRSRNNNETSGCKHCNCKKSNCLKLYCECFSAGSYCDDGCSCEKCLNKPEYEDTVNDFRKQIELRNPHAFAARFIGQVTGSPANTMEEFNQITPSSARHKRECNCRSRALLCSHDLDELHLRGRVEVAALLVARMAYAGCSERCRCVNCENPYSNKSRFSQPNLRYSGSNF